MVATALFIIWQPWNLFFFFSNFLGCCCSFIFSFFFPPYIYIWDLNDDLRMELHFFEFYRSWCLNESEFNNLILNSLYHFLILFYRLSKQLFFDDNLILSNQLMWMHLGCVRVYVSISITHTLNPYVYLKLKVTIWLIYATPFILNKEMDYFTLTWLIQAKFKNWSSLCL